MKEHGFFLRAGITAAVAAMLLLLAVWSSDMSLSVNAAPAGSGVLAMQNETDYPYPYPEDLLETEIIDEFYPGEETEFPFDDGTLFPPDDLLNTETAIPTELPNTFLTENAEMSGGQVTPPASATPGPTITVYISPTAPTRTPRPTRIPAGVPGGSGPVNWGYFSLGFAVPVLAACGFVLYLLDRRPDLFRRS